MFTPSQQLTNPAPWHFLALVNERKDVYNKPDPINFFTVDGKPFELDLHKVETWKKYKLGMYHPKSGIDIDDITPSKEDFMQSILDKASSFRNELRPNYEESEYPPIACLNSDGHETVHGFNLDKNGLFDFENPIKLPGDGRVLVQDAVPPKGYPVVQTITNKLEHTVVLNDLDAVDKLLTTLLKEGAK